MKRVVLTLVMGAGFLVVFSQAGKNLVHDPNASVRKVNGFDGVEVSGAIDLYLSQGNEDAVAVSAGSEEVAGRMQTEIRGSTLHIYFDGKGLGWKNWGNNKMKAYVTFKNLRFIEASGACNVKATEPFKAHELFIQMSGASDFNGEVTASDLRLEASGASKISIAGSAGKAAIEVNGASEVKGYGLKTDMARMNASGASGIRITVNKEMSVSASGGSAIYYKGSGLIRDISTGGGATIKRRSED
ncbi:MAG: hypothetical protein NVSMB63_02980 [Sediminibacterium sp.]